MTYFADLYEIASCLKPSAAYWTDRAARQFWHLRGSGFSPPPAEWNRSIRPMQSIGKLYNLGLSNTKITDVGLKELKGLKNLKTLWLQGKTVTDEGIKNLKQSLPDCRIHR
jgi:hypothetical protein